MGMTYREYWSEVDQIADLISDADALAHDYGEDAEPYEVLWEIADAHEYVIYTHKALGVMTHTDNADAYIEEYGEWPPTDSWSALLPPLAMMALIADVNDRVSRANPRRQSGAAAPFRGASRHSSAGRSAGARHNPKANGKWTRETQPNGITIYARGGTLGYAVIVPYKPRKSPMSASYAAAYEVSEGRKVPKGTKWLTIDSGTENISAHRTLKAAKQAGERIAGPRADVRQNPWPPVPEGALATSYNPPPSPFGRQVVPEGALATSYNPPPSPFGRAAFSNGTLQGQRVNRTMARQPLSPKYYKS